MSKLREWRLARGWTLQETAFLAGCSVSHLSLAERGKRGLSPQTKVRMARNLGVDLGDLFDMPADRKAPAA